MKVEEDWGHIWFWMFGQTRSEVERDAVYALVISSADAEWIKEATFLSSPTPCQPNSQSEPLSIHNSSDTSTKTQPTINYYQNEVLKLNRLLVSKEGTLGLLHVDTIQAFEALLAEHIGQNNADAAEDLLMRTLNARRHAFGQTHSSTTSVLYRLMEVSQKHRRYSTAAEACKQIIQVHRSNLTVDKYSLQWSMQRLASIYYEQGNYKEAETVYVNILKEIEELPVSYTPSHNSTIYTNKVQRLTQVLNEMAHFYTHGKMYLKAEQVYCRLLVIHKANDTPQKKPVHLTGLVTLLKLQKVYQKPERLTARLLHIYTKVLGAEHPLTVQTLNGLAEIYKQQDNYLKAEEMYLQLLRLQENTGDKVRHNCIQTLTELKTIYQRVGDQSKLEATYLDLLERRKQTLGLSHEDTAQTINNLASLYGHQGRDGEAIELYRQLVAIQEKALGAINAKTRAARNNLERLLRKTSPATPKPNKTASVRTTKQTATGYVIPTPPKTPESELQSFTLNMNSVQQKIAETAQVQELLQTHFQEDTDVSLAPSPVVHAVVTSALSASDANPFHALDNSRFVLLNMLLQKPVWKLAEISALAAPLGLMASGALEQFNDMAYEIRDEPIFEGDDPVEVNLSLAKELLA